LEPDTEQLQFKDSALGDQVADQSTPTDHLDHLKQGGAEESKVSSSLGAACSQQAPPMRMLKPPYKIRPPDMHLEDEEVERQGRREDLVLK